MTFKIIRLILLVYILLSPFLTIIHFTFFNGTKIIVHSLILIPTLIALVGLRKILKNKIRIPALFLILSVTFFIIVNSISLIEYPLETAVSLLRFASALMLFFLGSSFYSQFLNERTQHQIIQFGILGLIMGILIFYLTKHLGYTMTHSITADSAIAPLILVLTKSFHYFLFAGILIFLSGKSANLVAFTIGIFTFYSTQYSGKSFIYILFILLISLIIYEYREVLLPNKLNYRLDILLDFISGNVDFDSDAGIKLSSGRNVEILSLIEKWKNNPRDFYFGSGLFTEVEYMEGKFRSTIHMSYFKVIDMIGIFGFSFFLIIIINAVRLSLKFMRYKQLKLFCLFVLIQLTISFFQYTLLQDPMLWISYGILFTINKKKEWNKYV